VALRWTKFKEKTFWKLVEVHIVIFVNENENENGEKQGNDEFVNEN